MKNKSNFILVFDLDNTLILRDDAMLNCIEHLFDFQLSAAQKLAIKQKDQQGHSDRLQFSGWLKSYLGLSENRSFIWNSIRQNIGNFVPLNQGVNAVITELKDDFEMLILTNGGIENQMNKINRTGLLDFFSLDKIFISEAIGYKKPAKEAFQVIEDQYPAGTTFCMIGDQLEKDILSALSFGWKAIHLTNNNYISNPVAHSINQISSLTELKTLLNEL